MFSLKIWLSEIICVAITTASPTLPFTLGTALWSLVIGEQYNAPTFLDVKSYRNIVRWAEKFQQRPAVIRSSRVNKVWGDKELQMRERHSCEDFL